MHCSPACFCNCSGEQQVLLPEAFYRANTAYEAGNPSMQGNGLLTYRMTREIMM